uniref:C2H2-type domain-containing protein n=1 Tax=Ditylum brightwellii TaxID=49249 RepID=A0A7S1ZVC0_9STRA
MYLNGPSAAEQTDEYAPPEVLFGSKWVPFDPEKPQSYDSWSIGVVALEMLLGTPNVFSVDQRTTTILSTKMKKKGATPEDIRHALYLAALSQFCIYIPTANAGKSWPLRAGDPLHGSAIVKPTCTMEDFHSALRARDPLGTGFDSSSNLLLELIWDLLAWDTKKRLTPKEALAHRFFQTDVIEKETSSSWALPFLLPLSSLLSSGEHNALESQMLDPRMDFNSSVPDISEFVCPRCGKSFEDYNSCHRHANSRRHAKFCTFDRATLPPCLNAHSMLPAHPTSGYCDIQGRRRVIEDFHTIHLDSTHQFYGVFDGHNGNLASKYAASSLYKRLVKRFAHLDADVRNNGTWKEKVSQNMAATFEDLHEGILQAASLSPGGVMKDSGTTATALFVTEEAVIVANVGDSRAILSQGASYNTVVNEM